MRTRLTDMFLRNYGETHSFSRQRAGFLLSLSLVILVIILVLLLHTVYLEFHEPLMGFQVNPPLIMTEFLSILVLTGVIYLLYAGYGSLSAHLLLTSMAFFIFLVMLLDNAPDISRLDTIVLILALLSMTPLVVSRSKQAILGYGAGCIVLLAVFLVFSTAQSDLSPVIMREYLLDNSIAIIFMTAVSYNIFRINQQALHSAQWEITARKSAEDELFLKNALLQAQTEASPDGILFVDATGHIVSYNRRFAEMWRIPREVLESESDELVLRAVHANLSQPAQYLCRVHYLYEHPQESGQDEFMLVDGRCFERKSEPVEGQEGEYLGRVWYFRDITARKEHEDALRASEERYRRVVDEQTEMIERISKSETQLRERTAQYQRVISTIPSIFWQVDADAQLNFTKFYCSAVVEKVLGLTQGDINNDMWAYLSYIDKEDLPHIIDTFKRLVEHPGEKGFCEYRIQHADGIYRWFYTIGASIVNDAGQIQIFGVTEDITERKLAQQEKNKLEDQLRQAQKMESIGRLAGGIAHDFNNLLTAISGNIDLAFLDLQENKSPQKRLLAADKAAGSAAQLTKQLLAFSRKQIIEPQILDLNQVIEQIYKLLIRVIGEDIELQVKTGEPTGRIKADPGQIEQILINLVVNARDAMPEGGKLIIATADITLDETYCRKHTHVEPGPHVLLTVTDTGAGMNDEVKQHLFEPFFTTKPKGKGTGLGLATIYGAVMQHGGSIDVYSEPGLGATFKLYFPCVEGEVDYKPSQTLPETLPQGTETILLVEDEPQVIDFARDILMLLGYNVIAYTNAEDALAQTDDILNTISLLMTDIVLPGMNGRMLSTELAARNPYLKVLFTSGYTEDVIVHHGMLEEGIHFIGKPYTVYGLAGKIREILDAHPVAMQGIS